MKQICYLLLLISVSILNSCSKNSSSSSTPPIVIQTPLTINNISPAHGSVNDTITITGTGFSSTAGQNTVSFNGKQAVVISASTTQVITKVPSLAGTGNVSVTVNGVTTIGSLFTYDTLYKVSPFATGLNNPQYLTEDVNGNLYVTNFGNGTISKISSAGSVSTFVSGLTSPTGITIDNNSNLYVATNNNLGVSTIFKINSSGVVTSFATMTGYVYGLSIDISGNLYAANVSTISKINTSGVVTTFVTLQSQNISGIVVSNSGNIYATGNSNGTVYKITSTGLVSVVRNTFSFAGPNGIVVDQNENLYLTVFGNNTLSQFNTVTKISSTGVVSTLASGFDHPIGIILDNTGNFYIVNSINGNTLNGTVSKITIQ